MRRDGKDGELSKFQDVISWLGYKGKGCFSVCREDPVKTMGSASIRIQVAETAEAPCTFVLPFCSWEQFPSAMLCSQSKAAILSGKSCKCARVSSGPSVNNLPLSYCFLPHAWLCHFTTHASSGYTQPCIQRMHNWVPRCHLLPILLWQQSTEKRRFGYAS